MLHTTALLARAILTVIVPVAMSSPASTRPRTNGPARSHQRRVDSRVSSHGRTTTPPRKRRVVPRYDFSAIEGRIAKELASRAIPSVTVSVAKRDRIVYERAFGYANMEHAIRATTGTVYRLASISKPLTATGIMVLQQRALLFSVCL
jgi:CubicO group peptidase (beta-lactamase class C family)